MAASLVEYGGSAIDERFKIDYFLTGIKCSEFDVAKASVVAHPDRFNDFESVKDHFVEIRRLQNASKPAATTRNVSAVGGRGGGGRGGRGTGCGRGDGQDQPRVDNTGTAEARKAGLPSQAEIDKCTHIQAKRYPPDEYNKFTPAKR